MPPVYMNKYLTQPYSEMSDTQRQYPAPCPICNGDRGFPYQVRTLIERPGHIEIKLRCRDCGHEWADVVPHRD